MSVLQSPCLLTRCVFDCICVYLRAYIGGSSEEQRYLSSIKREKEAFKRLIIEKSTMMVPLPALLAPTSSDNRHALHTDDDFHNDDDVKVCKQRVIVDVREFRSSLPSFLHERGVKIDAVTLTVGDFIVTPSICVERKSISDLFGSFK